ncbi:MAG: glucosaminidase domain-containing protein [Bacilli bacterium]|nr:glucosaminidase domain-containing protein [Bacilli bacterium]
MFKKRVLVVILSCILVFLVSLLFKSEDANKGMLTRMITISTNKASNYVDNDMEVEEVDINDKQAELEAVNNNTSKEETDTISNNSDDSAVEFRAVAAKAAVVYDGMTMDELASKLNRSLKNELSGKGYLYASYSLEKGVDPYLAVAISLEETGCNWNCSKLVRTCNNVGGMKGSGCGSYSAFPTLDDGIKAFIDNISRNYVAYGLTTADTMNPKYAANPAWSTNVNNYITRIKNS